MTPEAAALMDLRVSLVLRKPASVDVRLFGKIAYDERNVNTTTARIGGRLDRFYVDYTGTEVRKGDHIAEIYSPELFVAQQDLIKATKGLVAAKRGGTAAAVDNAGTPPEIGEGKASAAPAHGKADRRDRRTERAGRSHITLFAPQDGVVTKRHVLEGAYVKTGDPLFSVAGLNTVWLNLEAYETDLPWLHFAQDVAFTVEALPGKEFQGRIAYIDPELDLTRRVVRVRVNVGNPERLLKPGMFARAKVEAQVAEDGSVIDPVLAGKWISPMHPEVIRDEPGKCPICGMDLLPAEELGFIARAGGKHDNALLVPASAVLQTGARAVVYVRIKSNPEPVFEGREIVVGARVGDHLMVDSGLHEGEMVVTRGGFKLDSELQLSARPSMMNRNAGLIETPAAEAEKSLVGQWDPVRRALARLGEAAAARNKQGFDAELATIRAAVDRVNTSAFHAKTVAGWKEFSMRLRNALANASKRPASDFGRGYNTVRLSIEETGRYLGLPWEPVEPSTHGTAEELAELEAVLEAYFSVSRALAADNEEKALALIPALAGRLGKQGELLGAAMDIGEAREAFRKVSDVVADQVREKGVDRVGNAYVVHCPMVDDYEGADWLSQTPEIVNPYFGAEMLSCGTVKANLSFARTAADEVEGVAPKGEHHHHGKQP